VREPARGVDVCDLAAALVAEALLGALVAGEGGVLAFIAQADQPASTRLGSS
jgi:hypothetical protein